MCNFLISFTIHNFMKSTHGIKARLCGIEKKGIGIKGIFMQQAGLGAKLIVGFKMFRIAALRSFSKTETKAA